jgi:hypothetical protein
VGHLLSLRAVVGPQGRPGLHFVAKYLTPEKISNPGEGGREGEREKG